MAAQFDSVHKAVDEKLEDMSSALMSKFSSMLAQFQSGFNPSSVSEDSAEPVYSGCLTEPPSLRPTISTKSRIGLRFREGEEDPVPHESGLAQGIASARANIGETPETSRHLPGSLRVAIVSKIRGFHMGVSPVLTLLFAKRRKMMMIGNRL